MNRLKELRKVMGLTQEELADEIGVSKITILRWENGERVPKSDKAQALADFFGVSVGYLLGYEADSDIAIKKAKLLDIIIKNGYILQTTLDRCIAELNEKDRLEISRENKN